MTNGRVRAVAVAAGAAGAALFVWSLKTVGVGAVADAIERLGAGFLIVVALGGLRHLVRASAWRLCFEDPRALPLAWSVAAYLSGDAVGNVTPFGLLASEPSKIVLLRERVATADAIPALVLENLFYGASVVVMLVAGTATLLLAFETTAQMKWAAFVVVAAVAASSGGGALAARAWPRFAAPLTRFISLHRERLWRIAIFEAAYHACAVLEIWIALAFIAGKPPAMLIAFVLECVNRIITIAFQFVPMWLGVDEAGTGLVTNALGLTGATGVALALARKARVAVWTAIGLALLGLFRRRAVVTSEQDADRYRWRNGFPGAPAGRGPGN